MEFCLEKICENPKILFDSKNFINLKAPLLELLLKWDKLNMEEIKIWNNLLKWCFNQQNVMNDHDIEPTDFFYKVYCYKDILLQDLVHYLLEFHIIPNLKLVYHLQES
ncbi:hypothetical protein C1645_826214 [Glomus cerebriforme]|uniref:BACK domain-containing protein n=1 Tax=Glomus cerebriforme TaxID=658196 RepID=A0A397SQS5_9GLOM|nr:hypothetical protein C1645_826214 [Glomus cerebriforme]